MDEKNLIKNLTDQEYLDGFVVDKLQNEFTTVEGIDLQQDFLDINDQVKTKGPDSLYLSKNQINYDDLNYGNGNGLMTLTDYDRINLGTENFERVIDDLQFETYRVPDNQFQQRLDEKMNNAFDNAFSAGTQPNTVADLIAMQGTKSDLNDKIQGIDEYARTHFLSNSEKQTLKDEIIKANYKKWSNTVDDINNPATSRISDLTNAPRTGIRRVNYKTFEPTIITPELMEAIKRGGEYLNYTIFVSENNFKDIAREYFKQGGEFYQFMNESVKDNGPLRSPVIINRLLALFLPITNPDEYSKAYKNIDKRFTSNPGYFKGLVQAINRVSLREENGGSMLIKYDVSKFREIPMDQIIQKRLLIELLIKMGSSFHQYIGTKPRLFEGLTIFDKPKAVGNTDKIFGQYILKPANSQPKFVLSEFINSLSGNDVDNMVLLEDGGGQEEFKEADGGQAAGPTPTPSSGPMGRFIPIDQD